MLAAETILEGLKAGDTSAKLLKRYQEKIDQSSVREELWKVRNFHQAFHGGLWNGMAHAALQYITGGRGLVDPMRTESGYTNYVRRNGNGRLVGQGTQFRGDGTLMFDRLADVFHSGTRHDEDQPCHLKLRDPDFCSLRCVEEYGNPCLYFCPAAVYEMVKDGDGLRLKINASNCVHCKTCDIADPYQIIDWTVPEGGGGPSFDGM